MLRVLNEVEEGDSGGADEESRWQGDPWRHSVCEHTDKRAEGDGDRDRAQHQVRVHLRNFTVILEDRPYVARQVQNPESAEHDVVETCDEACEEQYREKLVAFTGLNQLSVNMAQLRAAG